MKVGDAYAHLPALQKPQPLAQPNSERGEAEERLRDLIAQKRAELETFRPFEELGKHLDLRA